MKSFSLLFQLIDHKKAHKNSSGSLKSFILNDFPIFSLFIFLSMFHFYVPLRLSSWKVKRDRFIRWLMTEWMAYSEISIFKTKKENYASRELFVHFTFNVVPGHFFNADVLQNLNVHKFKSRPWIVLFIFIKNHLFLTPCLHP